jgi:hypothetical protein
MTTMGQCSCFLKRFSHSRPFSAPSRGQEYCEFALAFTILDNGETVTQEIANGSEPFRVSAVAVTGDWGEPGIYRAYQALYVGGVANYLAGGAFIRVDPNNYHGD